MKKLNAKMMIRTTAFSALTVLTFGLIGCGGGGGGGSYGGGGSVLYYPYETLYGDVCTTSEPTPGCTFLRSDGTRITVTEDPNYNSYGHGSDDMWYVKFNASGTTADVYDDWGIYQYSTSSASFANYIGGSYIGLGTTGLFWENVAGGTYWWGKNGVLYSANMWESNYGKAINDDSAGEAADTNFAALTSEANDAVVKAGADKLVKEYGFTKEKATAVASALNRWGVAAAERGYTTTADMDKTFKTVFGVNFSNALSAAKDLRDGDSTAMKDLTNRSAAALGLKPSMAQKFVKGMYKKALASWGYDADAINW